MIGSNRRAVAYANILEKFIPKTYSSILDFGCGSFEIGNELGRRRPSTTIIGTDIKDYSVAPLPNCSWIESNGPKLPFKDKHFDLAYTVFVLHHTCQHEAYLRELSRVAKRVLVFESVADSLSSWWYMALRDWLDNKLVDVSARVPWCFRSEDEWLMLIKTIGYEPVVLHSTKPWLDLVSSRVVLFGFTTVNIE